MKRLKAAVVGTGFVGRVHIEGIRRLGNVEVYAIGVGPAEYPQFVDGLRQLTILEAELASHGRRGWVEVNT